MTAASSVPPTVADRPVLLLDGSGTPTSLIGGKAAALDRLIGWGVHVPPTAVVTADGFRRVVEQPELQPMLHRIASGELVDAAEVDLAFAAVGLPTDVLAQVCAVARDVSGGRRLVIRSSATVEDMAHSSFAGQYRSILDVDPDAPDALARAVLQVFASLWHPAPRAYRDALGIGDADIAMAAVMMPMIDAQRAGVVFTLDPTVTVPTLRIEVVEGQGEALVSGRRTPSVTQVRRTSDGTIDGDLSDELWAVVRAALDIEHLAGVAQDIEWAWDGELWIVQARPVTALRTNDQDPFDDDPAAIADVELTTEGIGEMLPGALPPLIWQASTFVVEEGFRVMLERLGVDARAAATERWLIRRVAGRAALDVDRLTSLMAGIPGAEQRLRAAYGMSDDGSEAAPRVWHRRHLLRHAFDASRARRRAIFDAEVVVHAVREIDDTAFECSDASQAALRARLLALVSLAARAMAAELTVSADAGAIVAAVEALLTRWLSPPEAARWAACVTTPAARAAPSPLASAAVFGGPTWSELGLEPASHASAVDEDEDPFVALLGVLESAPHWPAAGLRRRLTRRRLEHLVARAAMQLDHRERTKAAILAIGGDVRRIHLELGERLVAAGASSSRDDVVLLSLDEIECALGSPDGVAAAGHLKVLLDDRRRWHRRHLADDPLPARWRGLPSRNASRSDGDGPIVGWSVSGGRFSGRARTVTGPQDRIGKDEVLVAAATDPSWTPVLLRCGALVIERGGPLSHAAILAREFGLPAVFNVPDAVERLQGRRVLVDGDAGTVEILDDREPDEVIS